MPKGRLALTKQGTFTYCQASDENIGKGKCNHIAHQQNNETHDEFCERTDFSLQFNNTLELLKDYDSESLSNPIRFGQVEEKYHLTYDECVKHLSDNPNIPRNIFKNELKKGGFKADVESIYQTFDGEDIYRTTEDKAANLLYKLVKNHNFEDGNKRIAIATFVFYAQKNKIMYRTTNHKRLDLMLLTLLISKSDPSEKDQMINLTKHLFCDAQKED